MLHIDELIDGIRGRREDFLRYLAGLEGYDVKIFGGIIKRGWTKSNVDICLKTQELYAPFEIVEYDIRRLLAEIVRNITDEPITIMSVTWDYARDKIGLMIRRDILGRENPKMYYKTYREITLKIAEKHRAVPYDLIGTISRVIARRCEHLSEKDALVVYTAFIHTKRTDVWDETLRRLYS